MCIICVFCVSVCIFRIVSGCFVDFLYLCVVHFVYVFVYENMCIGVFVFVCFYVRVYANTFTMSFLPYFANETVLIENIKSQILKEILFGFL